MTQADAMNAARPSAFGAILRIGLIAGTLDIGENLIFNSFRGVTPSMVFHYIAAGLIGAQASARLGMEAFALGVCIHYAIALTWTAIYFLASYKVVALIRWPVVCGILYGGLVYIIMNFVVLPLTRVPHSRAPMTPASRVSGVLALLFCIGLTVALLTRRERAKATR